MPSGRTQVNHYFQDALALQTLASVTAILDPTRIDGSRDQGSKIMKVKAFCHIKSKTSGQGPIVCGFSTDLTATEVASALIGDPDSYDDEVGRQVSNRKVFPIWVFGNLVTDSPGPSHGDPVPFHHIKDFPQWNVVEGKGLDFFAFNADSTLLTTGTVIDWGYTIISEWMRD